MLDTQVRTSYGSTDVSARGVGPTTRPKARVAHAAAPPTPVATEGPGFTSHVVAPQTLLAAQEARAVEPLRRDDPRNGNATPQDASSAAGEELTEEERQVLAKLKKIDREVRAHERAHRAAGGALTGAASYTYTRGPDGQMYATSGEVSIDTGRAASAAETVEKMEAVIRAALAPINPSPQDVAVAAQARQVLNEALREARQERLRDEGHADASGVASGVAPGVSSGAQSFSQAHQAYRERGAQDGGAFLAQQARDALSITAEQGFSFIV